MKRLPLFLVVTVVLIAGCKKKDNPMNPLSSTTQPPAGQTNPPPGQTNPPGGTTPPPTTGSTDFVVFSNELKSGGGAFMYPAGDNQTLSFLDTSNTISGHSIRYAWTGGDVAGQHGFAGFDLMHTPELSTYAATPGKDLRPGGYHRVTFDARGTLASNVVLKVEVSDDGDGGAIPPCIVFSTNGDLDEGGPTPCLTRGVLSTAWQQFSIPVTSANLSVVKDFFKATFVYKNASASTGSGGVAYFDDIRYKP
jgi:hypothetical protein